MLRPLLASLFGLLAAIAYLRLPHDARGQSVVAYSRPEHEDLTFFVNHRGLEQFEVEGPVDFGDVVRVLMRRRANAPALTRIRDRFTYPSPRVSEVRTPDLFRLRITANGIEWDNKPSRFVVAAGRTFNFVFGATNQTSERVEFGSDRPVVIDPGDTVGYMLRGSPNVRIRAGRFSEDIKVALDVRPLAPLHVRVLDENGLPGPARVYLTGADGLAYAPKGSAARIATTGAEYYFHTRGEFDMELPSGATRIEATRGQEYDLSAAEIDLRSPGGASIDVRLRRWTHAAQRGWHSGDSHIHANYIAPHHQVIDPADVQLQVLAEDLNMANLVVGNSSGAYLHDEQFFEGKPHRLSRPGHIIRWNEEFRNQGMYGHMTFWNLKSLVHPAYTGFAGTPNWEDYPANAVIAERARAQGGAITYAHPVFDSALATISAREFVADAVLGVVDAIDVLSNLDEPGAMELWYHVLNSGFRIAASAGTDAFTNVTDHYTAGGGRVYVYTGPALSYEQWVKNYRAGRSFVSNGPIIDMTVNGALPGEELAFTAGKGRSVRVRANIASNVPFDAAEIVVNGKAVKRISPGARIDESLSLDHSAWIAIRVLGPPHRLIVNDAGVFAHTSPVYVIIGGKPVVKRPDIEFCISRVKHLIERTRSNGRFASDERRNEVIAVFERALGRLRLRLDMLPQ